MTVRTRWVSRLVVGVLTAAAVTAGTLTAPTPAAAEYRPQDTTLHNTPRAWGGNSARQNVNLRHVLAAINSTPRGETIRLSVFGMTHSGIRKALQAAHRRGVNVRVVTWGSYHPAQMRALQRTLGSNLHRRSWVKVCRKSCGRGGNAGIHHAKAITFTRTGSTRNLTMIMSGNLNPDSAVNAWNDMQIIPNDRCVHRAVSGFMQRMTRDRAMPRRGPVTCGNRTLFFYPEVRRQHPIRTILNRVECRTVRGHGVKVGRTYRTRVVVAMFVWTDKATARRLVTLRRQGCSVAVVVNGRSATPEVRKILTRGGVPTWTAKNRRGYMHAKVLAVSGQVGNRHREVMVTGSANLTRAAVRSNTEIGVVTWDRRQTLQQMSVVNRMVRRPSARLR